MPAVSDEDIYFLGVFLSSASLGTFFHGIYTCILAGALWAIASNKEKPTKARLVMVFVIIILYISTTVYVANDWIFKKYVLINNGETYDAEFHVMGTRSPRWLTYHWLAGAMSGSTTLIADIIMIWRCWVIWGGRYEAIVLQTLLLCSQDVFGWLALLDNIHIVDADDALEVQEIAAHEVTWLTIYLSFSLGTTLLCTILIIYRIVTVGRSPDGIGAGPRVYHRVIEIFVESASLYVVSLIFWMSFNLRNDDATFYPEIIYVSITGFAPTLIVARVASGQARPSDSWKSRNTVSTIQFGGHSVSQSESVSAEEGAMNNRPEIKVEVDGLESNGDRTRDSVFESGRRITIDLERN